MPELQLIPGNPLPWNTGRNPRYALLEPDLILYVIPPPAKGAPGFVSAVSVGRLILQVAVKENLDPATRRHYVLFAGCDERFLGQDGSFLFARVEFFPHPVESYARLGTFFANVPTPCPDDILTLCAPILGDNPKQVAASSDWVLPSHDRTS